MTGAKREIKAGIGYTLGNILIKGISFLSIPIFTRILDTTQYGVFNTYMAYEAIIATLMSIGMYASIKNSKYDFPGKVDLYVSTIIRITLYVLAGGLLLVGIFRNQLTVFTGLPFVFLIVLMFQSYGSVMLSISNAKLSLDYHYKKYLAFAFFNTILNVGLSIILIQFVFRENRECGRILGSAIPLILIACYVVFTEGKKASFKYDKKMAKYALLFGLPMVWHYMSQTIQSQIDRIMISRIVDNASTGIYSFAYSIAVILQVIYYSTDNVWSVWMYERMDSRDFSAIQKTVKKYILLITTIAGIMLVGSREFIMVMSKPDYWTGVNVFIPCLLGIYMLFLYTIPAGVEYYYKETKFIAIMTSIAAVINIVMNYILISRFGYNAAAFATMISYAVTFLGHWFVARQLTTKKDGIILYDIKTFIIPYFFLTAIGVAVYFLNPYPLIKYGICFIIVVIVGFINKGDLQNLIAAVKRKVSR